MRTTLNLDDELMRAVKRRAAETHRTITRIIEDAVRDNLLLKEGTARKRFKLQWTTVKGRTQPDIDLTDRDALIDRMEDQNDRG